MLTGILAVQGAFREHAECLERLSADYVYIRNKSDISDKIDRLILPGGESTVQRKLISELGMFDYIKDSISNGMPVLGTCAGLILLAQNIVNGEDKFFGTLPVSVCRNAYGRQLGSFVTNGLFADREIPMTFIRAPYIDKVGEDVEILAKVDGNIIAARQDNMLVTAFHPELNDNTFVHRYFLNLL